MFRKMKHAIDILEGHEAALRDAIARTRDESLVRYLSFEQQKEARAQIEKYKGALADTRMALGVLRKNSLNDSAA